MEMSIQKVEKSMILSAEQDVAPILNVTVLKHAVAALTLILLVLSETLMLLNKSFGDWLIFGRPMQIIVGICRKM